MDLFGIGLWFVLVWVLLFPEAFGRWLGKVVCSMKEKTDE